MTGLPDESEAHQAGTLPADPRVGTKPVAVDVPRVLTMRELLNFSAEKALNPDPRRSRLTTGHYKLDRITGGYQSGMVWVLAADSGFGKSSDCIKVADENIRAGKRCLVVSSEDSEKLYGDRFMCRRARVDALAYRDGRLSAEDAVKVKKEAAKGELAPTFIYAGGWKLEDLCIHVDRVIKEAKIDWVGWDWLGAFRTKRNYQDERIRMREMAAMMRIVIKRNGVTGCIYSQVTIDDKTEVPTRQNIRDCRDVAHAADVIVLGFKLKKAAEINGEHMPEGTRCLIVDKVKDGPTGFRFPIPWDARSACFDTVLDPEAERIKKIIGNDFDDFGQDGDWRNQ
jgi:replicative DNA helicase